MNKKRVSTYIICSALFFVLVVLKQSQVRFKRNRPIVSTFSEWQRWGKPVVVRRVVAEDVPVFIKITAWPVSENVFEAYVSKEIQETIREGQEISAVVEGETFPGKITQVARDISFDTGMYRVQVAVPQSADVEGWVVAYVHTDTLRNVICIANTLIEKEEDALYVWKAEDGHAVKQYITIGQRDGFGAVILDGIRTNDAVIYKGYTQLIEGDAVNIIGEEAYAGSEL